MSQSLVIYAPFRNVFPNSTVFLTLITCLSYYFSLGLALFSTDFIIKQDSVQPSIGVGILILFFVAWIRLFVTLINIFMRLLYLWSLKVKIADIIKISLNPILILSLFRNWWPNLEQTIPVTINIPQKYTLDQDIVKVTHFWINRCCPCLKLHTSVNSKYSIFLIWIRNAQDFKKWPNEYYSWFCQAIIFPKRSPESVLFPSSRQEMVAILRGKILLVRNKYNDHLDWFVFIKKYSFFVFCSTLTQFFELESINHLCLKIMKELTKTRNQSLCQFLSMKHDPFNICNLVQFICINKKLCYIKRFVQKDRLGTLIQQSVSDGIFQDLFVMFFSQILTIQFVFLQTFDSNFDNERLFSAQRNLDSDLQIV